MWCRLADGGLHRMISMVNMVSRQGNTESLKLGSSETSRTGVSDFPCPEAIPIMVGMLIGF